MYSQVINWQGCGFLSFNVLCVRDSKAMCEAILAKFALVPTLDEEARPLQPMSPAAHVLPRTCLLLPSFLSCQLQFTCYWVHRGCA